MSGPRIFVCDNYDSFTFNLVQYLGELGAELTVERNDAAGIDRIAGLEPDGVVVSPGPGVPSRAGISIRLVRWCAETSTPLLGVCLGHQALGEAFGGRIGRAPTIMHGKVSEISHKGSGVFDGLPDPFTATRYHSLVVEPGSVPDELEVTASTDEDVIMGLSHRELPLHGVQFHPESILTGDGMTILRNFLGLLGSPERI